MRLIILAMLMLFTRTQIHVVSSISRERSTISMVSDDNIVCLRFIHLLSQKKEMAIHLLAQP